MKSYWFLFWAYNVVWIGLAAFLLLVFLRARRVDRRLDGLERELRRRTESEADQRSSDS